MNDRDFSSAPYGLSNPMLASTFGALVVQSHASLAHIRCVNVAEYLKGLASSTHPFHRETIPVIHSSSTGIYAVEFYDSTTNRMHRLRRFYNLVIGMCQSGQCRVDTLRHAFFYLQIRGSSSRNVSKFARLEDSEPTSFMAGSLDRLVDNAWEYDPSEYVRHKKRAPDEYHLTGLICEKAYILFDDEVADFVAKKVWR